MIMVADSLPSLKRWIVTLELTDTAKLLVIRVVVAFLLHAGRMSCLARRGLCAARLDTGHKSAASWRGPVGESLTSIRYCSSGCWTEKPTTACSYLSSMQR